MKLNLRILPGLAAGVFAAVWTVNASLPPKPATPGSTPAPSTAPPATSGSKVKIDEELAKIDAAKIEQQKAPDYSVKYTTEKKARPKDWLEIEFPLKFKAPKLAKDATYLDEVILKYYVFLQPEDANKKKILTAEISYVNVPVDDDTHAVVYLSPATLVNLTGKKSADKSLIRFWGVEAFYQGKLVGIKTSTGDDWWTKPNAPTIEAGRLLPKLKTPYAPLFYDYYLEEKSDR